MGLLLALASSPVLYLAFRFGAGARGLDASSLGPTVAFAFAGGAVATLVGAGAGILSGTTALAGGRWLVAASCVLVAAPPAFWWLGATRLPGVPWGAMAGPGSAALVAGLCLSPVPMLLIHAALREMPSNLYEAARVALPPERRLRCILLALLKAPLIGGFLLTVILLLGESEIPFLFGFRTSMTDIVTVFSRTFDVEGTIPLVVPLLLVVLAIGAVAGKPLLRALLASSRGAHGVLRKPVPTVLSLAAGVPAMVVLVALAGYALAALPGLGATSRVLRLQPATVLESVAEPLVCAWMTLLLVVVAGYPARAAAAMRRYLWVGLLLFTIPAAVFGIGWIGLGQALGGVAVPPVVAHSSRGVGLVLLGFAVAYSRVPRSLEDAARLVNISPPRRAHRIILPLMSASLVAVSALVGALVFADRDVASLLLPPGASRLMLDLYLTSANAPSARIGAAALIALAGASLTVGLAAAGPGVLWRRRG